MHIVIIGNGIAGITAARHIRKLSDYRITVISDETDHFYSRTALMYLYMGHMTYENIKPYEDWFWKKNRIDLLRDYVEKTDAGNKILKLRKGGNLGYDKLLIATGSKPNMLDLEGMNLQGVQALYGMPDLRQMEANTRNAKQAVIVGGGLIGVEMAEMLITRKIPVIFLVRETEYFGGVFPNQEAEMITNEIHSHGIDLRLTTELTAIEGDGYGRVKAVRTSNGETIECQFLGVTIGVHPNLDLVEDTAIETDHGILVNEFLQTSVPDVFAAGDCVQLRQPPPGHKAITPFWYTGAMMGEQVAQVICGKHVPYDPGLYFNSAKFLNIEWQVYGHVPKVFEGDDASIFWQHSNGKQSVRLVYNRKSGVITGFNVLGIRFRQMVCEDWMINQRSIKYAVEHLEQCQFDPEFHNEYNEEIREVYNETFPSDPVKQKRRKVFEVF